MKLVWLRSRWEGIFCAPLLMFVVSRFVMCSIEAEWLERMAHIHGYKMNKEIVECTINM